MKKIVVAFACIIFGAPIIAADYWSGGQAIDSKTVACGVQELGEEDLEALCPGHSDRVCAVSVTMKNNGTRQLLFSFDMKPHDKAYLPLLHPANLSLLAPSSEEFMVPYGRFASRLSMGCFFEIALVAGLAYRGYQKFWALQAEVTSQACKLFYQESESGENKVFFATSHSALADGLVEEGEIACVTMKPNEVGDFIFLAPAGALLKMDQFSTSRAILSYFFESITEVEECPLAEKRQV